MHHTRPISLLCTLQLLVCFCLLNSAAAQTADCPPNIDFEEGTLNHWELFTGSCCPISTPTLSGPITGRHDITTGAAVDIFGNFPIVAPSAGVYSLKLGNSFTGAQAERARYYIHVPATASSSYMLIYKYAIVLEDPNHSASEQPRFEVSAYDSATGKPIPCTKFSYVSSAALPGFVRSNVGSRPWYKDWTTSSIDLSSAKGKTVAIDFASGDCSLGGHFGYGYVDVNCGLFETKMSACKVGDSTSLAGPPGFQYYTWYDSSFTIYYGSGMVKNVLAQSGVHTYAVIITPYTGFGCPDTLYTTVSTEYYKAFADPDTSICLSNGQSKTVQLNASTSGNRAPFRYHWTPSAGLSCITCIDPIATVSATTGYTLTIIDSSNCPRTDTVAIKVYEDVASDVLLPADTVCQYEAVTVKNDKPHHNGFSYFWYVDTGKIKSYDTTGSIVVGWNSVGLKKVLLRTNNAVCNAYDSAYVYVKPTAIATFDLPQSGCIDKEVTLLPKHAEGSYHWTVTEQEISDTGYANQYKFKWQTSGQKLVTLHIDAYNGCDPPTDTSIIYINDNPPADIGVGGDGHVCFDEELTLTTPAGRDFTYGWSPAEYFENNNHEEVTMKMEQNTVVRLTVGNRWGCISTDSIKLEGSLCCKIIMPGAFSPNRDGHNDTYHPIGLENHRVHTFIITNRWGQVVFNTNDPNEGWNGNFKHDEQPIGTYFYYIKYICNNGGTFEKQGNFELIR